MRINKYVAQATGLSHRAADQAITADRVALNGRPAALGDDATDKDSVKLDGQTLTLPDKTLTIMLNKPVGYVSSRDGQGSRTIYDLLPAEMHNLKPVGRLDKNSSGLLLLTNDGELANRLTHPRYTKTKVYEIELDKPLSETDITKLAKGVQLEDGLSALTLKQLDNNKGWQVTMSEGRNRQIRRTFETLGYTLTSLHRTDFGPYSIRNLAAAKWRPLEDVNKS